MFWMHQDVAIIGDYKSVPVYSNLKLDKKGLFFHNIIKDIYYNVILRK